MPVTTETVPVLQQHPEDPGHIEPEQPEHAVAEQQPDQGNRGHLQAGLSDRPELGFQQDNRNRILTGRSS